jgi:hypothetical protein
MECAICFEAITAQTGCTTMACSHSFHFGCLVKWFGSQAEKDIHESCPCCRHEATEHERLPEEDANEASEQEESDEEESDEESDEESEEDCDAEHEEMLELLSIGWFNYRSSKYCPQTTESLSLEYYAAMRIQAAWRAYLPRMAWVKHKMNVEECKIVHETLVGIMEEEARAKRQEALHKLHMTSSRAEWRNITAIMIQTMWRGYAARQKAMKVAFTKGYKINWVFKGCHWQRSFLRNCETWYPHEGLPPQSLAFQNHTLWTRVQAAWRGYSTRMVLCRSIQPNCSEKFKKTACEKVWERLGETVD